MKRPKTKNQLEEWGNEHIGEFSLKEVEGAFKKWVEWWSPKGTSKKYKEYVDILWVSFKKILEK